MGGGMSRPSSGRKSQEVANIVLKYKNIDLPSKFKEFDTENLGYIGSAQYSKLIEWILEVCEILVANKDVTLLKILARAGKNTSNHS